MPFGGTFFEITQGGKRKKILLISLLVKINTEIG